MAFPFLCAKPAPHARLVPNRVTTNGPAARERNLTGPLTEHPDQNGDTLAPVVPGTSERRLQSRLTASAWDEDDLNRRRVHRLAARPPAGEGPLIGDVTGCARRGPAAVGGARQYAGTPGKGGTGRVASPAASAGSSLPPFFPLGRTGGNG